MALSFSVDDINQDVISLTMMCASVIIIFFGARFFKYIVFFFGFIAFSLLTFILLPQILASFDVYPSSETVLYASLIVGAFCGVLLVVIFKVAVITVGAIFGVILFQILWLIFIGVAPFTIPEPGILQACGLVIFAIAGAFIALKLVKQVLKTITAFLGGFMFATSTAYFIQRLNSSEDASDNALDWVTFFATSSQSKKGFGCDWYCVGCIFLWLALFTAGVFVQYKCYKKKKDRNGGYSESDDESSSSDSRSYHGNKKKRKRRKKRKRSSSGEYVDKINAHSDSHFNPGYYSQHLGNDNRFDNSNHGVNSDKGAIAVRSQNNAAYPPSIVAMSAYGREHYQDSNQGHTIHYV